jgi:CHAT domain-containing protein
MQLSKLKPQNLLATVISISFLTCLPGLSQESPKQPLSSSENVKTENYCDRVEEFCELNDRINNAIFLNDYVKAFNLLVENRSKVHDFKKNKIRHRNFDVQIARLFVSDALVNRVLDNYSESENSYLIALQIFERLGMSKNQSKILTNLGNLYERMEKYLKAEQSYLQARKLTVQVVSQGKENHIIEWYPLKEEDLERTKGECRIKPFLFNIERGEYVGIFNQEHVINSKSLARLYESHADKKFDITQRQHYYTRATKHYLIALGNQLQACSFDVVSITELRNDLARIISKGGILEKVGITEQLLMIAESPKREYQRVTMLFLGTPFLDLNRENISFKSTSGAGYADISESFFPFVHHAIRVGGSDGKAAHLAFDKTQLHKGILSNIEVAGLQNCNLRQDYPEVKDKCRELNKISQELSTMTYGRLSERNWRKDYENMLDRRVKLEREVRFVNSKGKKGKLLSELNPHRTDVKIMQAILPKNAAFIEIVKYRPPKLNQGYRDWWDEWHYAAVVLQSTGDPQWINLGRADAIDQSTTEFRTRLQAQGSILEVARKLDRQVMAKIRPLLGDAKHLLISADSQLNLIPFEALQDESGQYLINRYQFSYLTSGRDLLRIAEYRKNPAKFRQEAVIVANPDYGSQNTKIAEFPSQQLQRPTLSSDGDSVDTIGNFGAVLRMSELAEILKTHILPTATVLSGSKATKTALKQLPSPRILFLGTHGFFLTNPEKEIGRYDPLNRDSTLKNNQSERVSISNPLLLSGLALAGFNERNNANLSSNGDNGVLTALEVAGLDLSGTQLVVLSACKTDVGKPTAGDGVYGLRRSLAIAGAESQVLSLWNVHEVATKDLMVNYFKKLSPKAGRGMGRHEALQAAKQEIMKIPNYHHPYYWAGFIPSGDWTPLRKNE